MCMYVLLLPEQERQTAHVAHLIEMGFPKHQQRETFSLAASSTHDEFTNAGYLCPRCNSQLPELPVDCTVCGLPNVTSSALARSFHHLFPVAAFVRTDAGRCAANISFRVTTNFIGMPHGYSQFRIWFPVC